MMCESYQQAHTPEQALTIIKNLAGKRLDPVAVSALLAVYERGEIKIQRFTIKRPVLAPQQGVPAVAAVPSTPMPAAQVAAAETASLERTRV